KTGTLTKNEMTITRIFVNNKIVDVSGTGYEPKGNFFEERNIVNPKKYELLLRIGDLCNNAKLTKEKDKHSIVGDPTEGSLMVLAKKGKFENSLFQFIEELPFDSERKRMSVIFKDKKTKKIQAYVKGAPDLLIDRCTSMIVDGKVRKMTAADKKKILAMNNQFANDALRVLGLAYKDVKDKRYTLDKVENNLTFVGMVGMIDPARPEVKESILRCKKAGIKVMVITGDHAITAAAVAKNIGLLDKGDLVLTGRDLDKMSDKELEKNIEKVRIIARALPIQKSRIVDALQKLGHIVAMTGDGVNDAPAIKKADIGIAMGITGTDVAKEVAGAILVDDNFSTIVNAISEGRNIYDKIIKSTRYLLSCNAGEIVSVFIAILLNFPLPLIPLQILLMNLVTDGLPAIGLGFEPSEKDVMERLPKNPKNHPISMRMLYLIVMFGIMMGAGTLFLFSQYHKQDLVLARTIAFTTLVMFEMFAVLGSRSFKAFGKLNPFSNRWLLYGVASSVVIQLLVIYWSVLQPVFGTVPLTLMHWLQILGISSLGFLVMEVTKLFLKKDT
ncbi:MAG: cation-transporting P-type ATPase, partial [Nanoarchaeota archaeon]|nr:cation-transporting P-type ATPase [Nanoarchaeota archaeon]